jgi:hypothetical protein
MSIITNNFGLPEPLIKAMEFDGHVTNGDISCSELISSPRIRLLKKKHKHEITEDASDRIWSLIGSSVHSILERATIKSVRHQAFITVIETLNEISKDAKQSPNRTAEAAKWLGKVMEALYPEQNERYIKEITLSQKYGDLVLSGTFDLFDKETGTLWDYKLTKTWAYLFPESRKSWLRQLNVYAFMLKSEGFDVKNAKICTILRDHDKNEAKRNRSYPQQAIIEIPIELQAPEVIEKYILERVRIHKEAETAVVLPDCTGQERWATSDSYAVMVEGGKRAVSANHSSQSSGEQWILDNRFSYLKKKLYVEKRPGESKKCNYCPVSQFCSQYKEMQK